MDVQPLLKAACPCGLPECKATGAPLRTTGHSRGCVESCPVCARPKTRPSRTRIPTQVRRALYQRCQGACEARVPGVCTQEYEHAHHRRRRSQGGGDYLPNLVALCHDCHRWVHDNPSDAVELGLLLLTTAEPPSTAVRDVRPVGPRPYDHSKEPL